VIYDAKTWQQVKSLGESNDVLLEWSPDGRLLAMLLQYTDEAQAIHLYDSETLEPVKVLGTGDSFTWSPNGEILAIDGPSKIYFYDTHSWEQMASIDTVKWPGEYRFSPDGKTIATVDSQQKIRLWDVATGKLISTFENVDQEVVGWVHVFDYNSTGESLLLMSTKGGSNFYAYVWDIPTSKVVYSYQSFLEYREAVDAAFSPDGQQAALLIYDTITIVNTNSGQVLKTIILTNEYIESTVKIAYSPDGKKLLTTGGIFDIESGAQLNEQGFPEFQLSPDGRILAGALRETHRDGVFLNTQKTGILLWDVQKGQKISSVPGLYEQYHDVSFSPDEKQIASFDEYKNVQIHDVSTGAMLQQFHFGSDISSIAFGPKTDASSGYILAVGEDTGRIQVWDMGNHQVINTFFGAEEMNPVAISPNGQFLAYHFRDDSVIQIADIFSGKILRNSIHADNFIQALGFSPDGQTLVGSSNYIGNLFFWDVRTGQLLKTVSANGYDFSFFPHTNQPAWAAGNSLQLWDETVNQLVFNFVKEKPDYDESYLRVVFSSDGRLLAAGTTNALIDIWDVEKGQLRRTIKGHQLVPAGVDPQVLLGDIKSLAFSPYNHVLASAGVDCTVRIWNADNGLLLQTFLGSGPVLFSPDGSTLAYGGCADGKIYLASLPNTHK